MSQNKTIKFFISSTFKDFENERNILKKFVFPKLKDLCHKNGFGFQPIDLRWGVQEEAGYDQQTMNICLNEIKRSSHKPSPNLLLLVGQRYGWVPIPYNINNELFTQILNSNKIKEDEINLLNEWYQLDKNSIPNTRYLKDKWLFKENRRSWSDIEDRLKSIFQKVVDESFNDEIYRKFHTSATEQEMYLGLDAFDKNINHEHTFAYFRELENYDLDDKATEDYIDKDIINLKQLKEKLQNESNIPEKNQINLITDFQESKVSKPIKYEELSLETCPKYLLEFHDKILEKFTNSINSEIENYNTNKTTELQIELEQQEEFLKDKSKIVIGRETEVNRILEFVKDESEQFYLQYGKSGSGKTSIMAKAISDLKAENSELTVIYRFIGTTANSTYSRQVFESIYWDIESQILNQDDISKLQLEIKEREFKKQFKSQLEKLEDKKVVIFLDALDQFTDFNDLTVLLEDLPSNIKIVFSTLYDEDKKDNRDYSQYFNRLNYLENKYELLPLKDNTNIEILEKWLELSSKTLNKNQWKFLGKYLKDITPLHLKLIFEIVKHWKSEQKELHLEDTQEKLIMQFFNFIQTQYHHEVKLIENSMGLISASKDGLSEEEILDLLSNDKEFLSIYESERYPKLDSLPNAIWSRFYFYIEPFFTEKLIDGELLINPYHRIIEEVIKETYYNEKSIEFHEKLASYFYNQQDRNETWDKKYYSPRMLSELPYQLYNSKNSNQLKEILFDLEFAGSIYNNHKHESFRNIMGKATSLDGITEDEIYPWESFYREKEHLILRVDEKLRRPHQSLFQLAYEDGLDSPLSEVANLCVEKEIIDWFWLNPINKINNYNRTGIKVTAKNITMSNVLTFENKIIFWDTNYLKIFVENKMIDIKEFEDIKECTIVENLLIVFLDYSFEVFKIENKLISVKLFDIPNLYEGMITYRIATKENFIYFCHIINEFYDNTTLNNYIFNCENLSLGKFDFFDNLTKKDLESVKNLYFKLNDKSDLNFYKEDENYKISLDNYKKTIKLYSNQDNAFLIDDKFLYESEKINNDYTTKYLLFEDEILYFINGDNLFLSFNTQTKLLNTITKLEGSYLSNIFKYKNHLLLISDKTNILIYSLATQEIIQSYELKISGINGYEIINDKYILISNNKNYAVLLNENFKIVVNEVELLDLKYLYNKDCFILISGNREISIFNFKGKLLSEYILDNYFKKYSINDKVISLITSSEILELDTKFLIDFDRKHIQKIENLNIIDYNFDTIIIQKNRFEYNFFNDGNYKNIDINIDINDEINHIDIVALSNICIVKYKEIVKLYDQFGDYIREIDFQENENFTLSKIDNKRFYLQSSKYYKVYDNKLEEIITFNIKSKMLYGRLVEQISNYGIFYSGINETISIIDDSNVYIIKNINFNGNIQSLIDNNLLIIGTGNQIIFFDLLEFSEVLIPLERYFFRWFTKKENILQCFCTDIVNNQLNQIFFNLDDFSYEIGSFGDMNHIEEFNNIVVAWSDKGMIVLDKNMTKAISQSIEMASEEKVNVLNNYISTNSNGIYKIWNYTNNEFIYFSNLNRNFKFNKNFVYDNSNIYTLNLNNTELSLNNQ